MRKPATYQPSTGHRLIRLVTDGNGKKNWHISGADVKRQAISIAGPEIADWALPQLLAVPDRVRRGWAARRKKAVR